MNAGSHEGVIDEVTSDDLIEHERFPGVEPSKEGVKQVFTACSGFPNFHIEVHETLDDASSAVLASSAPERMMASSWASRRPETGSRWARSTSSASATA